MGSVSGLNNGAKRDGIETCASDECAIDIGLRHQRFCVLGLHASAVLDSNLIGARSSDFSGEL